MGRRRTRRNNTPAQQPAQQPNMEALRQDMVNGMAQDNERLLSDNALQSNDGMPVLNEPQLQREQNMDGPNINNGGGVKPQPTGQPAPGATNNGGGYSPSGGYSTPLDEFVYGDGDYQMRTKEEIEAQRKADKRNALFAAIGDGVSALSNLYFTTKGSPSADHSEGKNLSTAVRNASERWWKDESRRRNKAYDIALKKKEIEAKMRRAEDQMMLNQQKLQIQLRGQQLSAQRLADQNRRFAMMMDNENNRWYAEHVIDLAYKLQLLNQNEYQSWNTYIQGRKNGINTGQPPKLNFDVEGLMKELDNTMGAYSGYYGYSGYSPYSGYGSQPQAQQPPAQQQPQQQAPAAQTPQQPQNQPQQNQGYWVEEALGL